MARRRDGRDPRQLIASSSLLLGWPALDVTRLELGDETLGSDDAVALLDPVAEQLDVGATIAAVPVLVATLRS
jgi:hypothetical protein